MENPRTALEQLKKVLKSQKAIAKESLKYRHPIAQASISRILSGQTPSPTWPTVATIQALLREFGLE